jgi:hypothetical protein
MFLNSRWVVAVLVFVSACYYSSERYLPPSVFSNELVQIVRDDPAGSIDRFIQFGLHIRNLDSRVIDLNMNRIVLRAPNGSIDSAFSPVEIWEAAQQPMVIFVATNPTTHDLVWHPSPAQAVTLCLESVSIAPFSTINRVVVFPYPSGLRFPDDTKVLATFTIEIEGSIRNGEIERQFPKLTWQSNGFNPTVWRMPDPGHTR